MAVGVNRLAGFPFLGCVCTEDLQVVEIVWIVRATVGPGHNVVDLEVWVGTVRVGYAAVLAGPLVSDHYQLGGDHWDLLTRHGHHDYSLVVGIFGANPNNVGDAAVVLGGGDREVVHVQSRVKADDGVSRLVVGGAETGLLDHAPSLA